MFHNPVGDSCWGQPLRNTQFIQPGKINGWSPKSWKWMENDVPFQLCDFGVPGVNFPWCSQEQKFGATYLNFPASQMSICLNTLP